MAKNMRLKILYGEADEHVAATQAAVLTKAGYAVEQVIGRKAIEVVLAKGGFDLVVLGHTLTRDDRHHLPYMAKKANEDAPVVVLHASGHHPKVDAAVDSRLGESAVLRAISGVLLEPVGA